jgi:hypothetical protein
VAASSRSASGWVSSGSVLPPIQSQLSIIAQPMPRSRALVGNFRQFKVTGLLVRPGNFPRSGRPEAAIRSVESCLIALQEDKNS